jgi:enoyl-CoA hydratase/carnithine racemase
MADLLTEVKDRVLYLTLNRPDKLNAMSNEMMGGLVDNLGRGPRILLGRRYRRNARAQ